MLCLLAAMPDESRTYLGVFGFGSDPSVVTDLLGLEPTQAYAKGEMHALPNGRRLPQRERAWRLEGPLPRTAHVDEQIEALLGVIEPYAEAIREAASRYEVEICCAIYYADFTAGIHLTERTVQRIGALRLSVDFDLYFLVEHEGKEA